MSPVRQRQPQREVKEPTGPGVSRTWEQLGNKEGGKQSALCPI